MSGPLPPCRTRNRASAVSWELHTGHVGKRRHPERLRRDGRGTVEGPDSPRQPKDGGRIPGWTVHLVLKTGLTRDQANAREKYLRTRLRSGRRRMQRRARLERVPDRPGGVPARQRPVEPGGSPPGSAPGIDHFGSHVAEGGRVAVATWNPEAAATAAIGESANPTRAPVAPGRLQRRTAKIR